eukprot:6213614-Pleurochrysis_carterae.AAC.4
MCEEVAVRAVYHAWEMHASYAMRIYMMAHAQMIFGCIKWHPHATSDMHAAPMARTTYYEQLVHTFKHRAHHQGCKDRAFYGENNPNNAMRRP